ncbi:MAG: UDP-forming cellulose synthase catalytic subunit [Burkholderiales bacterium]
MSIEHNRTSNVRVSHGDTSEVSANKKGDTSERIAAWWGWSSPSLILIVCIVAIGAGLLAITVPLDLFEQFLFAIAGVVIASILMRVPGRPVALVLVLLSIVISLRYFYWRVTETAVFDTPIETVLGIGLIAAELYALIILLLGYFQTSWPMNRRPVPLPADAALWPSVDVFIPTFNEPLAVVRPTVLAAMSMDWPGDRLNVCILDDGKRAELAAFAKEIGATYLTRADNRHAKAGNINAALERTDSEFIAVFDCDHIPTRSFLQMTMGWFLKDRSLGMVQTPHHFFSPDPFEKNLRTFRRIPNEDELFYGLVQSGNDLWNAAFFCGSCAVLRRTALAKVGGIATDTLTEDAHTSIKLHRAGYPSAYLGIPQASGLATETLRDHVRQRSRWARGMAQIFRLDNPLISGGLTLAQRLCYLNAMLHFFYGLPRIVFLTAPLAFLFFGLHIFKAPALLIAIFALPHLLHAYIANSRLNGPFRHSFWAEVFETTLAWYVMRAAIGGVLRPRSGAFVVTPKGGHLERDYFDWKTSFPILLMFVLNVIGLVFGVERATAWNTHELDTVIINMAWTVFNLIVLGASLAVAWEIHQTRDRHRVRMRLPAALRLPNGTLVQCETSDFSDGGLSVNAKNQIDVQAGTGVEVVLYRGDREFSFAATVAHRARDQIGLRINPMPPAEEAQFLQCTFARADAWVNWTQGRARDKPLKGLAEVIAASLGGVWALAGAFFSGGRRRRAKTAEPITYQR